MSLDLRNGICVEWFFPQAGLNDLTGRIQHFTRKESVLQYNLISGDNHIDLTYCPPDLWSADAPAKWKLLVPRVEELDDGLHWFVEGQDKGMWNGVGPGFLKYQKGMFARIDTMKDMA